MKLLHEAGARSALEFRRRMDAYETNVAPENSRLEKEIHIGNHKFRGYVSFREGIFCFEGFMNHQRYHMFKKAVK